MARFIQTYLRQVEAALEQAMCIQPFPSPKVERYDVPQVEVQESTDLLRDPVIITRSDKEMCLIETSINSFRVSLRLPVGDVLESELLEMYMGFLMKRADSLQCLRKVPVLGYHVTFLITDSHLLTLGKNTIMDLIMNLITQTEADITGLKLAVNARGRAVATHLLRSLAF